MKRATMEERLMVHRNHAVFRICNNIDIKQYSVRSMCSVSVATGGNLILIVDASVLVDVFSAVIIAGKNACGSLKSYINNKTVGNGIEERINAKLVTLDSSNISNTKHTIHLRTQTIRLRTSSYGFESRCCHKTARFSRV